MEGDQVSVGTKTTKSAKERARDHRKRKAEYIRTLQIQVKQLQSQVIELTQDNERLKVFIASNHGNSCNNEEVKDTYQENIQDSEKFAYEDFPKMFKERPEQVKFTMIHETFEKLNNSSPLRINLIKNAFTTILDSILAPDTKCFYS